VTSWQGKVDSEEISSRCNWEFGRFRLGDVFGRTTARIQYPSSHRFVGNIQPALSEQIFYVAIAEGEANIEPRSEARDGFLARKRAHDLIGVYTSS
jgi:hypothetical protein